MSVPEIPTDLSLDNGRRRGAFTEIRPRIYQRGQFLTWPAERKMLALTALGIDVIVNLWCKVDPDLSGQPGGRLYIHWPIHGDRVPPELPIMLAFLTELYLAGKTLLIVCEAGRNRSIFLCAALLQHQMGITGTAALELVRQTQSRTHVNRNLLRYLEAL